MCIRDRYIPVVRVAIPKNDTAPKSDNVSIATNAKPATIAGLADGKMILKKDLYFEKPRFVLILLNFETDNEKML